MSFRLSAFIMSFFFVQIMQLKFSFAQRAMAAIPVSETMQLRPDSAFLLLREKLQTARQNNDRNAEAISLQKMGELLYHAGNYPNSIEQLLTAEQIFREMQHLLPLADNLTLLGIVYCYNRQYTEAMAQFKEAIQIYSDLKDYNGLAEVNGQIGHIYEKLRLPDSAFRYQKTALGFAQKAPDKSKLFRIYEHIGSIYEDREQFDSAGHYFLLSLEGYQALGNWRSQIEVLNNLGDIASKGGDYKKGLQLTNEAAQLAFITGEKYQLQSAYRDIAEDFFAMKEFDSAYLYLEKSRDLVQSIYAADNARQIALMQTLNESEKKNAQISRLNTEGRIKMIVIISSLLLLILSAIVALLIINRQKIKMKAEKLLHEKSEEMFHTQKGLMESELLRKQLEEKSLKDKLDIKSRELSSHILQLIEKNDLMEELKTGLSELIKDEKRDQKRQLRVLQQKINLSFAQDSGWNDFRVMFEQAHPSFFTDMKTYCPELTASELRLMSLIKMNLSSADISRLLGITSDSLRVTRYRLKKKLNLDPAASLSGFIQSS